MGMLTRRGVLHGAVHKQRLVLDATRGIAPHEDVSSWPATSSISLDALAEMVRSAPGGAMWSEDAKSGYHHASMHPKHQRYLAFIWPKALQGDDTAYVFCVAHFGLRSAGFLFDRLASLFSVVEQNLARLQ